MGEHELMCTRAGAQVMVPAGLCLSPGFWLVPLAVVRRCSRGVSCSSFDHGLAQVGLWEAPVAWGRVVRLWCLLRAPFFFFFLRRRKNQGQ